jgi:hypothetical protein
MCTTIYIASGEPLPLVEWDESSPGFHMRSLDDRDREVRKHFRAAHVYSVGSYQGCACGLAYEPDPGDVDQEAEDSRRDRGLFADYLDEQLRRVSVIELFTCRAGDEHAAPVHRAAITPEDIREGRFDYEERTYVEIRLRT